MNDKDQQWSKPNYDAWKRGIREVASLPSPRFYFAVTVIAMVSIAYALARYGTYWPATFFIAILILIFGATAFAMQWRREGDDQSLKKPEAESTDQSDGASTPSESSGGDERRKLDRSHSPSTRGIRASVESEGRRSSDRDA